MNGLKNWLVVHTSHGLWDWMGVAGTSVLGIVAIVGGWVGLKSFLASSDASSHAHMHAMFLRFIDARPRISSAELRTDEAGPIIDDIDFGGSALYFLEEVFAWTRMRERAIRHWYMALLISPAERRRRLDIVASWEATVTTQLLRYRTFVLPSLLDYTGCYGLDFLNFAAKILKDPALCERVEDSNAMAEAKAGTRVLGEAEKEQRGLT